MTQHALRITDRGAQHRHRYQGDCVCGWDGPKRRRRKEIEDAYHLHLDARRRGAQVQARGAGRLRAITPADRLPEQLRIMSS